MNTWLSALSILWSTMIQRQDFIYLAACLSTRSKNLDGQIFFSDRRATVLQLLFINLVIYHSSLITYSPGSKWGGGGYTVYWSPLNGHCGVLIFFMAGWYCIPLLANISVPQKTVAYNKSLANVQFVTS